MDEDNGFKERYLMKDFIIESSTTPLSDEEIAKSKEFLKKLMKKLEYNKEEREKRSEER